MRGDLRRIEGGPDADDFRSRKDLQEEAQENLRLG